MESIQLIVEDSLHPPRALDWFPLLVFKNEGKELGIKCATLDLLDRFYLHISNEVKIASGYR